MKKIVFFFPGQGSQYPGMGASLVERYPTAARIFHSAGEILDMDVLKVCGDEALIGQTDYSQPLILTFSYALFNVYMEEIGICPAVTAGHSLGEISALTCAGAIGFPDALKIVQERGRLMRKASEKNPGGMTAVMGLDAGMVEKICESACHDGGYAAVANFNSPGQTVITGNMEGIAGAARELEKLGGTVIPLKVSGPFHSRYMKDIEDEFEDVLSRCTFRDFRWDVVSNVDARLYESKDHIISRLKMQLSQPVLWSKSIELFNREGISACCELGPGSVLSRMTNFQNVSFEAKTFDSKDDVYFKSMDEKEYRGSLGNFINRCLALAVSTKNHNLEKAEYEKGVIRRYNEILSIDNNRGESQPASPSITDCRKALSYLQTILSTKKLEEAERKAAIDNLLHTTGLERVLAPGTNSSPGTLFELFEQTAALYPGNTALTFHPSDSSSVCSLTYCEVNRRSNKLARVLRKNGAGPGVVVGIMIERSPETVIAVLAVLKSGGAYLPLSPDTPLERTALILSDSGAGMVLTRSSFFNRLPGKICKVDITGLMKEEIEDTNLNPVSGPENPAYVIYTSGTGGRPRGVMINHSSITKTILWRKEEYGVMEWDSELLLFSFTFDGFLTSLFTPLAAGARIVMANDFEVKDVLSLKDLIVKYEITRFITVPGVYRVLMDCLTIEDTASLEMVTLAGEKLTRDVIEQSRNLNPSIEIVNEYGPTENTVLTTCARNAQDFTGPIYIGTPLPGMKLYVVRDNKEVPPGEQGELYIGGYALARGYLGNEALTEEKFIKDFPGNSGRLLFRTGDLVTKHPGNNFEFHGRLDQQIKVNGFRIEPEEIENALMGIENIREAVVVQNNAGKGREILTAYYTTEEKKPEYTQELLRERLSRIIPDYMMPGCFMEIPALPRTGNLKVDRKNLPGITCPAEEALLPPENELEEQIARFWQKALGLDNMGMDSDFFTLGGHSISMMEIISEIHKAFRVRVSYNDFVEHRTIRQLSCFISEKENTRTTSFYPSIENNQSKLFEPFPLTDVQMAYFAGRSTQFELGGVSTHGYIELEMTIDARKFQKALGKIIKRHPMLHAIVLHNGHQQILEEYEEYVVKEKDVSSLSGEEQKNEIEKIRARLSHYVFDPEKFPLFEFFILKLSDQLNYLFVSFDLLMIDGASIYILGRELNALCRDQEEMPPLNFTYRDYLDGYRKIKKSAVYEEDKNYWMSKMENFPPAPGLPVLKNPGAIVKPHFKRQTCVFSKEKWKVLKQKAEERGITVSALLCAAYAEVLSFWSSQSAFTINLTAFNRYPFHPDIDKIIGDFTSIMLLDVNMKSAPGFWDRARELQFRLMNALEHRHFDGIEFIREIAAFHNHGTKAVMPIVFTSMLFDNSLNGWNELGNIKYEISQTSQAYLDNQVKENNGELSIVWDYVEELFEEDVISVMFNQYTGLLSALSGSGECKITLAESDRRFIEEYNNTDSPLEPALLHELFIKTAGTVPGRTAVIRGAEKITYQELDKRSNQAANYFCSREIFPGDSVGIQADSSINSIILMLGVLKTGASFIPIDPGYPGERKKYIQENSQCKMVIDSSVCQTPPVLSQPETYKPETSGHRSSSPAYTIYTSGSTGKPKGVMISHAQASNTILCINNLFALNEKDRILNLSSFAFDLSIYDIFGAFSTGASVVLVEDARDMANVREIIEREQVTIWNSVPSTMSLYTESVKTGIKEPEKSGSLRLVMLSGDVIPLSLPGAVKELCPGARVVSLGGATEGGIWSIYYEIDELLPGWSSVPYGRPLANQKFYVLSEALELLPPEVEGELFIGGKSVASGYANNPGQTEEAFISHPVLGRLYKTGDFGVLRRDGYIEFRGRRDGQVKIRGYRIELLEIESNLLTSPFIKEGVVRTFKAGNGQEYIAAYYTTEDQKAFSPEFLRELKEHLRKDLPGYMIPDCFIHMEKLPLTPNGKINRRILPEPDFDRTKVLSRIEEEGPGTRTEEIIKEVWEEVIGIGNISINDNFFDIGGNSILLTRIYSKLETRLGGFLRISDFFAYPTIKRLAVFLNNMDNYREPEPKMASRGKETSSGEDIAIVGISGEFPRSKNLFQLWEVLEKGVNCVREFPDQRREDGDNYLRIYSGNPREDWQYSTYAYLDRIDEFDCKFFKFSPNQSKIMSPVQRLFLEHSWGCIEDAGYTRDSVKGSRTGVYLGYTVYEEEISYTEMVYKTNPEALSIGYTGVYLAMIPSRISYFLDLTGPTMLIDTACSSSLVALHTACEGIKQGDCDMAIAGGIRVNLVPVGKGRIGIESSNFITKTFDDSSDGTGFGEGVAAVLLKPLSKALEDKDHIYGIIKNTGINQDGGNSVSISAPNPIAQSDLITHVLNESGIDPGTISYIEAHGTGTNLGDPIEIEAITKAYNQFTDKKQFCGIGSIKTNFGHLLDCSGMASLFKIILCLKNKKIPPNLFFNKPNKKIDFLNSPVYVVDKLIEWKNGGLPRRCAINSFGFSGTNCHVIMEEPEYIQNETPPNYYPQHFLLLSARSEKRLKELVWEYKNYSYIENDIDLYNACYVTQTGREHYDYRLALLVNNKGELDNILDALLASGGFQEMQNPSIFYGDGKLEKIEAGEQGKELIFNLKELYGEEKLIAICRAFAEGTDFDFKPLYVDKDYRKIPVPHTPLENEPYWLSLAEEKPVNKNPGGESLDLQLVSSCLVKSFNQEIYYACLDPDKHWIMGEHIIFGNPMLVATGFIELVLEAFIKKTRKAVEIYDFEFKAPLISEGWDPIDIHIIFKKENADEYSVTVAGFYADEWSEHAKGKVRSLNKKEPEPYFFDSIKSRMTVPFENLTNLKPAVFIKLSDRWYNCLKEIRGNEENTEFLAYVELDNKYDIEEFLFYPALVDVALNYDSTGRDEVLFPNKYTSLEFYKRIPRKFYSYTRRKESGKEGYLYYDVIFFDPEGNIIVQFTDYMLLKTQEELLEVKSANMVATYNLEWTELSEPAEKSKPANGAWMVLWDRENTDTSVISQLRNKNPVIIEVEIGGEYKKYNDTHYRLSPVREDFDLFFEERKDDNITKIIHLATLSSSPEVQTIGELEETQNKGLYSLYAMAKSILQSGRREPLDIRLVTNGVFQVTGKEVLKPHNATITGLGKVLNEEYQFMNICACDIDSFDNPESLLTFLELIDTENYQYQLAVREGVVFRQTLYEIPMTKTEFEPINLADGKVYIITGGTGGIGLEIARYIALNVKAVLCLVNRSKMPERDKWDAILEEEKDLALCQKIGTIMEIEETGAVVRLFSADVSRIDDVKKVIDNIISNYGQINGIIHSAGLGGKGFFIDKEKEVFDAVLNTKMKGAWILDNLTAQMDLDFFVLFSSTISVLGVEGQSDYTAANAYLDSFSAFRRSRNKKTLSVNWPGWSEIGMAVNFDVNEDLFMDAIFLSIGTADAIEGFSRVINKNITNAIIAKLKLDLSPLYLGYLMRFFGFSSQINKKIKLKTKEKSKETNISVILEGRDQEDYSDMEYKIGQVWCEVFGFKAINVYDSYYDLGGDSIIASAINRKITERIIKIDIINILEYPTIAEMAEFLNAKLATDKK